VKSVKYLTVALTLGVGLALAVSACGGSDTTTVTETGTTPTQTTTPTSTTTTATGSTTATTSTAAGPSACGANQAFSQVSHTCVDVGSGNVDGAVPVHPELLASLGCAGSHGGTKTEAPWIRGDERLGEQREACSTATGIRHEVCRLLQRASNVERDRRRLDDRDAADHFLSPRGAFGTWPRR